MYFKTSLFCNLLLASVVLAVPTSLGSRVARRREGRQSRPNNRTLQADVSSTDNPTNSKYTEYSQNWSGAVFNQNSGTFIGITATITIPVPTGNSGSAAAAWVGIDGDSCNNVILQTGVDFDVGDDGQVSYAAWYEWYPDYAYFFSGISISAGDTVVLTVAAESTTSGTATIENKSNGQQVSQYITSSTPLCMADAEWIVEDFSENGGLVPFANFNNVVFSQATAPTAYGNNWIAYGADPIDIVQNGQVLANAYIDGSNDVIVTYV